MATFTFIAEIVTILKKFLPPI